MTSKCDRNDKHERGNNDATPTIPAPDRDRLGSTAARLRRPPVCGARIVAALPARVPARRLRLREPAGSVCERFLLRIAAEYRDRQARCRGEHWRARAGRQLGACARTARLDRADVQEQGGRVRAVRRHRRPVTQSLRDAGQHRTRRAERGQTGLQLGLHGAPLVDADRQGHADRVHRCVAADVPRRKRHPQHLAARGRQARVRRTPVADPDLDVRGSSSAARGQRRVCSCASMSRRNSRTK